jgi:hypothetical protein
MSYSKEQTDELKRYCEAVSILPEGGIDLLHLTRLRLPAGCTPSICDALLCPGTKDGYPSRLHFSVQVSGPYTRNWNLTGARIGEKNWWAFSWRVDGSPPTLAALLVAHLNGFAKEK